MKVWCGVTQQSKLHCKQSTHIYIIYTRVYIICAHRPGNRLGHHKLAERKTAQQINCADISRIILRLSRSSFVPKDKHPDDSITIIPRQPANANPYCAHCVCPTYIFSTVYRARSKTVYNAMRKACVVPSQTRNSSWRGENG